MIIDSAQAFIRAQREANKHPQFTPYPSTWLNAESWNDEIDSPPVPQQGGRVENTVENWLGTGTDSATTSWGDFAGQGSPNNSRELFGSDVIDHEPSPFDQPASRNPEEIPW